MVFHGCLIPPIRILKVYSKALNLLGLESPRSSAKSTGFRACRLLPMPICRGLDYREVEIELIQYSPGDPRGPVYAGVPELDWAVSGFRTLQEAEQAARRAVDAHLDCLTIRVASPPAGLARVGGLLATRATLQNSS